MIVTSALVLVLFSVFIVGICAWGAVFPTRLITFVRGFMNKGGIVAAVGVRLVLAVLLWVAAPVSHTPKVFLALAALALAAAVLIALLGTKRVLALLDRLASWPEIVLRLRCALGVAFGVFLIWSVPPVWNAI